jgi:hypothetical protein
MRGAGIDLEIEFFSKKVANETSPRTPMHEIKGEELAQTVLCPKA